jgi:hypothetical protein
MWVENWLKIGQNDTQAHCWEIYLKFFVIFLGVYFTIWKQFVDVYDRIKGSKSFTKNLFPRAQN